MTQEITKVRKHFYADFPFRNQWIVDIVGNQNARHGYVQPDGTAGRVHGYDSKEKAEAAAALYITKPTCGDCSHFKLVSKGGLKASLNCEIVGYGTKADNNPCDRFKPKTSAGKLKTFVNGAAGVKEKIRKFDTGATRDTVEGKLDYVKALCPLVLRRYVQYLDKHRLQPDGNMRDFDNWKNGMPREAYHSSKGRHFFADWLLEEGYEISDNHGPVDEEDALCGELFNVMGKLREILRAKLQAKKE